MNEVIIRTRFVYFASCEPGYIKIGCTTNVSQRIGRLNYQLVRNEGSIPSDASPKVKFIGAIASTKQGYEDEREWHRKLSSYLVSGTFEWFHDCPHVRDMIASSIQFTVPSQCVPEPSDLPYITVEDAAVRAGLSADTVKHYLRDGTFSGVKMGRFWYVENSSVPIMQNGDKHVNRKAK